MYTLVVCDAEPVAIEGIRRVLENSGEFIVRAAEASLDHAMRAVQELAPSLLMVNKTFGFHAVVNCLKACRNHHPATAIVVWGTALSEAEALRFVQSGAQGLIRKTAPIDMLIDCLLAVCRGETWVEPGVLVAQESAPRLARTSLTSRELQVMELVERGMKNKEIAQTLGICSGTVKIHLRHIFEKTGIRGRYGLALSGLQAKGLLALPAIEAQ